MSYSEMLSGASWSAIACTALLLAVGRRSGWTTIGACVVSAFVMPVVWNCILRTTGATGAFSHDLRFSPFPISWQDTGTGVFTLAGAMAALSFGPARRQVAARAGSLAALAALAALGVDVYLY